MSSNVALFNPTQMPAFAKARGEVSALTKALAGGGGGGYGKRISIKGGVFRLIADGKEIAAIDERYLDVVVVNAADKVSRMYYDKKFVEGETVAPVCWSAAGDKPAPDSRAPQAANCASCPQNIKGSGDNDTRACRFQQRIAVVLANDLEGEVMQVQIPAKSLFGKEENGSYPLQSYARWLASNNVDANHVITRMKFDTNEASPKLLFRAMRWLTEDEHEIVVERGATEDAKAAVALTVGEMGGSSAPALPAPQQAAPAPQAEEEEAPAPPPAARRPGRPAGSTKKKEAPAQEEVAEPSLRTTAPTPSAVPPASNLANLAAQWDADD